MKSWFSSKTIGVGLAEIILGTLNNLAGAGVVDPQAGWALGITGALTIWLRLVTREPVKLPGPLAG